MNPQQLRYLIAIDEAGSVRGAARALGVSQAGLSESIKRLEQSAGQPLVVLAGRRLQLNQAGHRLATSARPVLEAFDSLIPRVSDREDFRVAAPDALVSRIVPIALRDVDAHAFRIESSYASEALEGLLAGRIDAAVMAVGLPHSDIEHHELGLLRMSVYGRADVFGGADIRDAPFVAATEHRIIPTIGPRAADAWPTNAFERQIRYGVTNMEAGLQICGAGDAVAYLPSIIADAWNANARAKAKIAPVVPPSSRLNRRLRVTLARAVGGRDDPRFWQLHGALTSLLAA